MTTTTQPAGGVLPELPEPFDCMPSVSDAGVETTVSGYTADQMRAYGELCRTTAPEPAKCLTCNDNGLIGGWTGGVEGGYDSQPCPDCTPLAPVPADPVAATWTLIGPDGRQWKGATKFACMSAEIDSRVPKTVQLERIMRAAQEEPETSPTAGMNLGERIAHVGGRTNAQGYVEFGSPMAVSALIQHVLRDIQPPLPAAPLHAEGGE